MSELEIRKTIEINASPEIIFRALSIQEEITQWFPDQAILEPKVGGKMILLSFQKAQNQLTGIFFQKVR